MQTNTAQVLPAPLMALINSADFLSAMDRVSHVIENRNTYPILANVRLQASQNGIRVTATDLDIEMIIDLPAMADDGLDLTLPAGLLKAILKGVPKSASDFTLTQPTLIQITKANGQVEDVFDAPANLDFGKAKYDLPAIDPAGFPIGKAVFGDNSSHRFSMDAAAFVGALNSVSSAISTEETRYYLNGIYMHVVGNGVSGHEMRMIATDGHRMLIQSTDMPDGAAGMPGVILPRKTVKLLQKLLKSKAMPKTVSIRVTDCNIRIAFDDVTITSKLIEGTFPDYERVSPKNNDKLASFKIADMQEALKAVSLIASTNGGKAVKLDLSKGELVLSANNPDRGHSQMAIDANISFEGEFEIGFNASYLEGILAELSNGGDMVTVAFNDSGSPTLFTGGKAGLKGVLMPMRV